MRIPMLLAGALALAVMPLQAQKPRRQSPTLAPPSAAPAAGHADTSRTKGRRPPPSLVGSAAAPDTTHRVATQSTAAAPVMPVSGFTAGLAIAPYEGSSDDDRNRYLRRFTTQLDSATFLLVNVFRNTSGQPMAGADAPTALSARERERWNRCRDLHFDLQTYKDAASDMVESLPESPTVGRAGVALDSALNALAATANCDNLASMITAPARWTPWATQYASAARDFYRDWYAQVREVSDRNRAFVVALNTALPATARIVVPPALPRTPPYAGMAPR